MQNRRFLKGGFALPTVLIASVVMMIILAASISSVAAVHTSLKGQYYEQLAKAAGEAGVAYAKACLAKNGNVPQWTNAKPLTPSTDCSGNQLLEPAVQVLVVAGGGGGGSSIGGGGGGGGVVERFLPVSTGSYVVTIGGGGSGGAAGGGTTGNNGANTQFGSSIIAIGGGGGGARAAGPAPTPASNGGSGGGGAGTYVATTGTGAPGGVSNAAGQGNGGGRGSAGSTGSLAGNGGGGGGAGTAGGNADGTLYGQGTSGAGGSGRLSDISGQEIYYGAGGSGGRWGAGPMGLPGITGGGVGGIEGGAVSTPGQANTGAGGGGGSSGNGAGGAGGSGVVVVRYVNNGSVTATGGASYTSGAYKIHRFTSSSTFSISDVSTSSCPSDPRCSVVTSDNMRSSFSIPFPTLDEHGRAVAIANNGYVELIRTSNGTVWRTYRQPAQQVAAVPDLCSGSTAGSLGWSNAAISSNQSPLPGITTARSITLADTSLNAGRMYFRKDFPVTTSGTYTLVVGSPTGADVVDVYVDGAQVAANVANTTSNNSISLSAGCHTIVARLTNRTINPRKSQFTAAVKSSEASFDALVSTDTTWRVAAGSTVHFSQSDFYEDPVVWQPAQDLTNLHPEWIPLTGDPFARSISAAGNGCPNLCPSDSTGYYRDSKDIVLSEETDVVIRSYCDDDCVVYVDGNPVVGSSPLQTISRRALTLAAGTHRVAVKVWNMPSAPNPSGVTLTVFRSSDSKVLTRTDMSWQTATTWNSGQGPQLYSYEDSFRPSPLEMPEPVEAELLAVGGGGGGGGNSAGGGGGGGVYFSPRFKLEVGNYQVSIGAGGMGGSYVGSVASTSGAATSISREGSPGNWYPVLTVPGGGGGASRDSGPAPKAGGSGGGGAGQTSSGVSRFTGAAGTSGFGFGGGNGMAADQSTLAKGGGGGGARARGYDSTTTAAGDGGAGFISYLTGVVQSYGGGGGGSNTASNGSMGLGADGGVSGGSGSVPAAPSNRGGGGGAAADAGYGGAGGSGIVIFRIKTGSAVVSMTGSGLVTGVTIGDVAYTVYTFTGAGTLSVISLTN